MKLFLLVLDLKGFATTSQVAQLVNLDGKSNSMKSSVWPTQRWHDFRLAWNKTGQFRDPILTDREFRLPSSDIWHAEIVLLNTRDGQYKPTYPVNMLINKAGNVTWMPPSIYISGCQVDATNFPYDSQVGLIEQFLIFLTKKFSTETST